MTHLGVHCTIGTHILSAFPAPPLTTTNTNTTTTTSFFPEDARTLQEHRNKRLREESVQRLVSDINRTATTDVHRSNSGGADVDEIGNGSGGAGSGPSVQQEELMVASTIATSIERGLDRELHNELMKQVKDCASNITRICHRPVQFEV